MANLLDGSDYNAKGLQIEIKRGATWRQVLLLKGDLSAYSFSGRIAKKRGEAIIAEFSFDTPVYDTWTLNDGTVYENYTRVIATLSATVTAALDLTPTKIPAILKAGIDYWEADIEAGTGSTVFSIVSLAAVTVIGEV